MYFFFNDTATTEIYTLTLHDALPIFPNVVRRLVRPRIDGAQVADARCAHIDGAQALLQDRKSTRLNSSHQIISYDVFCLKKNRCKSRRRTACIIRCESTPENCSNRPS